MEYTTRVTTIDGRTAAVVTWPDERPPRWPNGNLVPIFEPTWRMVVQRFGVRSDGTLLATVQLARVSEYYDPTRALPTHPGARSKARLRDYRSKIEHDASQRQHHPVLTGRLVASPADEVDLKVPGLEACGLVFAVEAWGAAAAAVTALRASG
jgi:hypothetical protein